MKNGDRTNLGTTGIGTTGIGPVNPMDKGVSATRLPDAGRSEGRTAAGCSERRTAEGCATTGHPEARVVAVERTMVERPTDGCAVAGCPEARVAAVERTMVERPADGCVVAAIARARAVWRDVVADMAGRGPTALMTRIDAYALQGRSV